MFLRISRMPLRTVHAEGFQFKLGKANTLREGNDVVVMANGIMVSRALDAANSPAKLGIHARVLNMSSMSPMKSRFIWLDAKRVA
jgi:transketolase